MPGILLVDKPAGWTSFDVVNYIRKLVAQAEDKKPKRVKVGHTGTLDPFATGLLVILIGKEYTRRAGEFSKLDKTYEVTMKLGETSSTGDPEGVIVPYTPVIPTETEESRRPGGKKLSDTEPGSLDSVRDDSLKVLKSSAVPDTAPSEMAVRQAVERFRGQIKQVPPMYSAVKINGQRAYKLARAGQTVVIEPRQVTVNRLDITDYRYPYVQLVADVSSGTYIRSLVEDLGQALGTGAYTTALRRTKVGEFTDQQAVAVTELDQQLIVDSILPNVI